jgi:DNA-binding NarL/FixJ family response regulator
MTAGASGYLGKGVRGEEIRAAIREVARGGSALSTEAQRALLAGLRARDAAENSPLTERELQMLELIAGGLSNAEVAAQLVVSPETVKSHLRNLYGKLEVSDRAAAVAEALRRGLID